MIEGEKSKVIDDNNKHLEAKFAPIDRFLEKEHKKFIEEYQGECLDHAFLLAKRIIALGERPEIWEIKGTNFDAKTIDVNVIKPKMYQGLEIWGIHYVCVCKGIVYDPMIGKPINIKDYMEKIFENSVCSKVVYSYEDLNKSTDINFSHHIREKSSPNEKQNPKPIEFKGSIIKPDIAPRDFEKELYPNGDFRKYDWGSFKKQNLKDFIVYGLLSTELFCEYPVFEKNNPKYFKSKYKEDDQKKYLARILGFMYLDKNYLDGEMSDAIQKLLKSTLRNDWSESKYGDPNNPIEKDFQEAKRLWEELEKNNNLKKKSEYIEYSQ